MSMEVDGSLTQLPRFEEHAPQGTPAKGQLTYAKNTTGSQASEGQDTAIDLANSPNPSLQGYGGRNEFDGANSSKDRPDLAIQPPAQRFAQLRTESARSESQERPPASVGEATAGLGSRGRSDLIKGLAERAGVALPTEPASPEERHFVEDRTRELATTINQVTVNASRAPTAIAGRTLTEAERKELGDPTTRAATAERIAGEVARSESFARSVGRADDHDTLAQAVGGEGNLKKIEDTYEGLSPGDKQAAVDKAKAQDPKLPELPKGVKDFAEGFKDGVGGTVEGIADLGRFVKDLATDSKFRDELTKNIGAIREAIRTPEGRAAVDKAFTDTFGDAGKKLLDTIQERPEYAAGYLAGALATGGALAKGIATIPRIAQAARAATTAVVEGLKKVAPVAVAAGGVLLASSEDAQAGVHDALRTLAQPGVASGVAALTAAATPLGKRVIGLAKDVVAKLGPQAETLISRIGRTSEGQEFLQKQLERLRQPHEGVANDVASAIQKRGALKIDAGSQARALTKEEELLTTNKATAPQNPKAFGTDFDGHGVHVRPEKGKGHVSLELKDGKLTGSSTDGATADQVRAAELKVLGDRDFRRQLGEQIEQGLSLKPGKDPAKIAGAREFLEYLRTLGI